MIVSYYGEYEFGSFWFLMILEVIVFYFFDNLDVKFYCVD